MVARAVRQVDAGPQILDQSRFSVANRKRISGPALRTFLAIADLWNLNEEERRLVLGLPPRSTFHNWCQKARQHGDVSLDVDVLLRISAVFGIHQALVVLFGQEAEGVKWLKTAHHSLTFGGQPPMAFVTSGTQDGLMTVRRFLDAARGGIYMPPNAIDLDFQPYEDSEIVFR